MTTTSTRLRRVGWTTLLAVLAACSSSSSSSGDAGDAEGTGDAGDVGSDTSADSGTDAALDPPTDAGADGIETGSDSAGDADFGTLTCRDDIEASTTIELSGTLACEACESAVTLWLHDNEFLEGEPLCAVTLALAADFALDVPADLGTVWLHGFGDGEGVGTLDAGEPFGRASPSPLEIAGDNVALVALVLTEAVPATDEMGGAIDEFGDPVTPDRLLVRFSADTAEEDARAVVEANGAELASWLDAIDTAVIDFDIPEDTADEDILEPLHEVEANMGAATEVEAVFRDYRYATVDTRAQSEDYLSLTAVERWAYDYIELDEAKRVYDQCSYHLPPADRAVSVVVGVIDNDQLGAQNATEMSGLVTSLADHHTHMDREFCGLTENGFQRLCEPVTTLGHGAAVTSAIAARNNGSGMNGVLAGFVGETPGGDDYALTYTLRLFNTGHGYHLSLADALNAIQAAGNSDAQVINMSFGVNIPSAHNIRGYFNTYRSFSDLIRAFPDKIWVMSAGNGGQDLTTVVSWVALDVPQLVAVGATDEVDARSVWSTTTSSAFGTGVVDFAAPGTAVYVADVAVTHSGTTLHPNVTNTVSSNQGYFAVNGTSLSAPLVTGALAYLRAIDAAMTPTEALRRARLAADVGPGVLGGRRLNVGRLVTADRAGTINSTATHLLSFIGVIESSSGGCGLTPMIGMECMPIIRDGGSLSAPGGIVDDAGNTYTLSGTIDGAGAVSITVTGLGVTAGVGPATTTYTGTATVDPINGANLVITGGAFTGQTRTADGAPFDCDYSGTFDATFRGTRLP